MTRFDVSGDGPHDHDLGLAHDLSTLLGRRHALKLLAGAALVTVGACGSDGKNDKTASSATSTTSDGSSSSSTVSGSSGSTSSTPSATGASCETIPDETAGPYPGDGSNGPDVLSETGIVRSDITRSFGGSTTRPEGVPLTVNLVILGRSGGCKAMAGAAVYLWHCDREGRYSRYSQGVTGENYLRGVQEADAGGRVTFETIFPAAYSGRWPHIHFEVYPTLAQATSQRNKLATSQLALPEDACKAVYATAGYEQSVRNLAQTSLARDLVFGDGSSQQLATMSGGVGAGFTAELSVPV
ncbi:MAG TPA: hypothetical protein VHM89_03810 [Acidimicrobiales bacterium]|nr:hypothetical protein [Acidimicrobiales bacterium]